MAPLVICLRALLKGGKRRSLASAVNAQLSDEVDPPTTAAGPCSRGRKSPRQDPIRYLASKVSLKLEEGDFRGAVRLACSDDPLADISEATYVALKLKHPYPHPGSSIPPLPVQPNTTMWYSSCMSVSEDEVIYAIKSFPNGSTGGPDGLRSQNLKYMIGSGADGGCEALLSALASFIEPILSGNTPASICPLFFGAKMTALEKQAGTWSLAYCCWLYSLHGTSWPRRLGGRWWMRGWLCWPPDSWVTESGMVQRLRSCCEDVSYNS